MSTGIPEPPTLPFSLELTSNEQSELPPTLKVNFEIGKSPDGKISVYSGIYSLGNYSVKIIFDNKLSELSQLLQRQRNQSSRLFNWETHPDSENILNVSHSFLLPYRYVVLFPLMTRSLRSILLSDSADGFYANGFPSRTVIYVFSRMLQALRLLHRKEIFHLNISAGHIFLDDTSHLKLGYEATLYDDIAIHFLEEDSNCDWSLVPGRDDKEKADIYLLGLTSLELIYGSAVFRGSRKWAIQEMVRRINKTGYLPAKEYRANPTLAQKMCNKLFRIQPYVIGKEFDSLIIQCLNKDPFCRPNASKLLAKTEKLLREFEIPDNLSQLYEPPPPPPQRE